jgi:hypothetical protein
LTVAFVAGAEGSLGAWFSTGAFWALCCSGAGWLHAQSRADVNSAAFFMASPFGNRERDGSFVSPT